MENTAQHSDSSDSDPRDRDFYAQMGVCAVVSLALVYLFI